MTKVGDYPLNNIRIEYTDRYKALRDFDKMLIRPEVYVKLRDEVHVKNIDFLGRNDIKDVITLSIYLGSEGTIGFVSINVFWRDEFYTLSFSFKRVFGYHFEIFDLNYSYKGSNYRNVNDFKTAIQSEQKD